MTFRPISFSSVFSELFGFCVADPKNLDRFHGGSAEGLDLLALYSTSELGDRVAATGAAIPVLGVEAGYYAIHLHEGRDERVASLERLVSSGWILEVVSGQIGICGLGYLKQWDPTHSAVRRASVPCGWYAVSLAVSVAADGPDDFVLEIFLSKTDSQPEFRADVARTLHGFRRASRACAMLPRGRASG